MFLLLMILLLLLLLLMVLLLLSPFSDQPRMLDQATQALALSLRNHLADPVMVAIDQLSRWPVSIFSAMALLLWLLGAGRYMAAAHWLVAIGGGYVLHLLLSWALRSAPRSRQGGGAGAWPFERDQPHRAASPSSFAL